VTQKKPTAPGKGTPPQRNRPASGTGARPATPPRRTAGQSASARRLQSSHRPAERGNQVMWIGGGAIVVLLVLLLGIGWYNDNIGPGRGTAIQVGKHNVSVAYFRDRLKAQTVEGGDGSQLGQNGAANQLSAVTSSIEEEQVYLQRAWSLGVTASDDDIAAQIAALVHVAVKDGKVADVAQYDFEVRGYLQRTGLSLATLREIGRAAALKSKVTDYFQASLPKQGLAIKGVQFTFDSQAAATAAQKELETGATVDDLQAELSADPTKGQASPLDWTFVGYGVLPHPVDVAAQQLAPGQVSTVIEIDPTDPAGATPTWEMLAITDKDANQALDTSAAPQIAQAAATQWYTQQRQALGVHSLLTQTKQAWAIQHAGLPQLPAATPTPPAGAPTVPGGNPSLPGSQTGPQPPASSAPAVPPVPAGTP
jgi:hypothetical protein